MIDAEVLIDLIDDVIRLRVKEECARIDAGACGADRDWVHYHEVMEERGEAYDKLCDIIRKEV